jgi:putative flippase GtrA
MQRNDDGHSTNRREGVPIQRGLVGSSLRYLIVGGLSVAAYVGGAAVCHRGLGLEPQLANALAYIAATVLNYLLNFYWSFKTTRKHSEATWRYLSIVALGVFANILYVRMLLSLFSIPLEVAALSFAVLWPAVSFIGLRYWALR